MEGRQLGDCILEAEPADPLAGCELGAYPVEFVVFHPPFLRVPDEVTMCRWLGIGIVLTG